MSESEAFAKQVDLNAIATLSIDESMSNLDRFMLYSSSEQPYRRQLCVKELRNILRDMSRDEIIEHVFPVLDSLKSDSDTSVRQSLAEKLGDISDLLISSEPKEEPMMSWATTQGIQNKLLTLLQDPIGQVRDSATKGIVLMAKKLGPEYITAVTLPCLKHIMQGPNEDYQLTAIETLGSLVDSLPLQTSHDVIFPIFLELTNLTPHRVVKAIVSVIPKISFCLSTEERVLVLVPIFKKYSCHGIWQVRKTCCETIVAFAKLLPQDVAASELNSVLITMAEDPSRWVKGSVNEVIGPYMLLYSRETLDRKLYEIFLRMPQNSNAKGGDPEAAFHCAFSFAAVLEMLGPDSWPEMHSVFEMLKRDIKFKVRRPLAFSLPLIAHVIGPAQAESDLLPIFEMFLMDLDQVRSGAIKTYVDFVEALSESGRSSALHMLATILKDSGHQWRTRSKIARSLPKLCSMLSPEHLIQYAVPTFFLLSCDGVGKVRSRACAATFDVFSAITQKAQDYVPNFFLAVNEYAKSQQSSRRQSYADMCAAFLRADQGESFTVHLQESFTKLILDAVPNVRLSACKVLDLLLDKQGPLLNFAVEALHALSSDQDGGVQEAAIHLLDSKATSRMDLSNTLAP